MVIETFYSFPATCLVLFHFLYPLPLQPMSNSCFSFLLSGVQEQKEVEHSKPKDRDGLEQLYKYLSER